MMRIAAFVLGAALLSGCQTMPGQNRPETPEDAPGYNFGGERGPDTGEDSSEDSGPSGGPDASDGSPSCPAAAYQVLVGQPIGEIHTDSLPSPRRIYGRGDMITMDYRSDRLNIVTGDDGRVVEVKCG
ncbi:I78 family peptidase inhibitor [Maricaulaceae bacterium MS644]